MTSKKRFINELTDDVEAHDDVEAYDYINHLKNNLETAYIQKDVMTGEFSAMRDALISEIEAMRSERDQAASELDALRSQRDQVMSELDATRSVLSNYEATLRLARQSIVKKKQEIEQLMFFKSDRSKLIGEIHQMKSNLHDLLDSIMKTKHGPAAIGNRLSHEEYKTFLKIISQINV